MYLMILSLFSISVFAGTVSVTGLRHYKLTYSSAEISISSPVINLHFKNQSCNKVIFEEFLKKTKRLEEDKTLKTGFKDDSLNFLINGKEFHESFNTPKAKFIDSLPEELERMKIEEKLRCKIHKTPKKS